MAFTVRLQKLVETQKRLVIKLVGIANGAEDETNVLKLDASTTNASSTCLATRTIASVTNAASALQITKIWANVSTYFLTSARVQLKWAGSVSTDTTGIIATFGAGTSLLDLSEMGGALINDTSVTGSITAVPGLMVSTTGFVAQMAYTLIVEMRKNGFSVTTLGYVPGGSGQGASEWGPSDFGQDPVGGEF